MKPYSLFQASLLGMALTAYLSPMSHTQEFNYHEAKVPLFTLPDSLLTNEGKVVKTAEDWWKTRRPEILQQFQTQMFGIPPGAPPAFSYQVTSEEPALGDLAIRQQVTLYFSCDRNPDYSLDLLIYLPRNASQPAPAFLGLNFNGNHTIHSDPGIRLSTRWMRNNPSSGVVNNRATEASRGTSSSRWALESILQRGYALATIYYGDIDPDFHDGFQNGIHPLFYKQGQTQPEPDQWGSIGAWSWGLSRALDYLEIESRIDAKKVAVLGHSRLGKTSLWAGAQDQRFALVISNNSGCGGAALSRRHFGETVQRINTSFPHWFCGNFKQYNENESALPFDQHQLIALIAPRPVYVASAEEDQWADPRGEFLSLLYANDVYHLLGTDGLKTTSMPPVNHPIQNTTAYHIRSGKHDVTAYDWEQYLNFADKHLKNP